jgi:gliding motility-associated-like protein
MRPFSCIFLLSICLSTNVLANSRNLSVFNTATAPEDTSQIIPLCQPIVADLQLVSTVAPAGGVWSSPSCGACVNSLGVFDAAGLAAGNYLVEYAQGIIKDTILVSIFEQALIEIDAKDSVDCGEKVTLTASGGQTYVWTPAAILNCSPPCETPEYTADVTTTFTVVGTNANGCSNTASITVNVRPLLTVVMPNAFTPNGDESNDIFRPICRTNIFKDYHLSIYSRWGERVFETITPGEGWDGKIGDLPPTSDVYVYVFEYELIVNGKPEKKSGEVTLIR